QCGPREHRREKALDRTITAAFARPTGHTKHRNPACHRYHSPCNPTELSPGSRRHMRLQALEKCYNGHHGLLRRLRVEVVVDYNSTTALRQKPCPVHAFWRRYCQSDVIFYNLRQRRMHNIPRSYYFKQPLDTLPRLWQRFYPNDRAIHPILREYFFAGSWNEVYDFIEFVKNNCPYQFQGDAKREAKSLNDILTRELSAYRLVGGRIVEITSEAELDAVEQALDTPFQPVNRHM